MVALKIVITSDRVQGSRAGALQKVSGGLFRTAVSWDLREEEEANT